MYKATFTIFGINNSEAGERSLTNGYPSANQWGLLGERRGTYLIFMSQGIP